MIQRPFTQRLLRQRLLRGLLCLSLLLMSAEGSGPQQSSDAGQGLRASTTFGWTLEPAKTRGLSGSSDRAPLEPALPARTLSAAEAAANYSRTFHKQAAVNPAVKLVRLGRLQLEGG